MKKTRRVLSLLLAMALLFGTAAVMTTISASAETTKIGNFFSFSPDKVTESLGVKAITATDDGGILFESTENDFSIKSAYNLKDGEEPRFITAVFDTDDAEISQGLETLRAEPNYRKLSIDFELLHCDGFANDEIYEYTEFGKKK